MAQKIRIRIAEAEDFSEDVIAFLKSFALVDIKPCKQEEVKEVFENYDVFWFRLAYKIDNIHFSEKSQIKVLATPVTGIDHINEYVCAAFNVKIVCLRGEKEFLKEIRATAEHTIGLTLALIRHLHEAVSHTQKNLWHRDLFRGTEIYKKKVGIVGLGRLGKITASYFKSFGAEVKAYDINHDQDIIQYTETLNEIAEYADILSIHLSLNNSTQNLINRNFLEKMKPNSVLINTSRGGIVNEKDLINALEDKKISGAALDVIEGEFEDKSNNVLLNYSKQHRNLIITPHIGGNTYESFAKTEMFIAQKIFNYFN